MRLILVGQKSFGLAAFDAIRAAGHDVATIWSPVDFGQTSTEMDVVTDKFTVAAWRSGLLAAPSQRTPKAVQQLEVDLIVNAHGHDFITREVREATRFGGIGYHPSLLPRHRGRDAVRWTIHMQDPIAGGSVYWLTDDIDGGPIAAQGWCFVPPAWRTEAHPIDGVSALWRVLFPMGIRLLVQVLNDLGKGVWSVAEQDELNATWEPSWERPPLSSA